MAQSMQSCLIGVRTMSFSITCDKVKPEWYAIYIKGLQVLITNTKLYSWSCQTVHSLMECRVLQYFTWFFTV